jgi:hypothetical protein
LIGLLASGFWLQQKHFCSCRSLQPGARSQTHAMFHAHCVCVVGKNYRLQDIQLSKNSSAFGFGLEAFRLTPTTNFICSSLKTKA